MPSNRIKNTQVVNVKSKNLRRVYNTVVTDIKCTVKLISAKTIHVEHSKVKKFKHIENCVYRFISPSGKSYIGKGKSFYSRYKAHKRNWEQGRTKFYCAIKKYKFEHFKIEILCSDITDQTFLNNMEIFYIRFFNTFGADSNGYNLTIGGDGTKLIGSRNGMYGQKHSKEIRKKISANRKGKCLGNDNFWHIDGGSTPEMRETRSKSNMRARKIKSDSLSKEEKESLRISRSKSAKIGYANSDKKDNILQALRYWEYKTPTELEIINKKKSYPGILNCRAIYYILISPIGTEHKISLISGLKQFCIDNNLIFRCFDKCLNDGTNIVLRPTRYDTKLINEDYKIKRINSVGWKITKHKIREIT